MKRRRHNEGKVWEYSRPDRAVVERLAVALDVSLPTASVLVGRGYTDRDAAFRFLHPVLEDLPSPMGIRDMERVLTRLKRAADDGEKVFIFGDTDVDGVTSVAMMMKILKAMGIEHEWELPLRLVEGYGFSRRGLERALEWGADLIVTLDCGIGSEDLFREAGEAGLETMVIDHHLAESRPPSACAVIDPKVEDDYPFKEFSTGGLLLKLAMAANDGLGLKLPMEEMFALSALSTVADVCPLTCENRVIVRIGADALSKSGLPGIRALIKEAGLEGRRLNAGNIGFGLGPRLNAAGRLGKAPLSVRLLISESVEEAGRMASEVGRLNVQRRRILEDITDQAMEKIGESPSGSIIIVAEKGWHRGVIGIVASNLVESYGRPAVVISVGEGDAYGSARSVPAFNIHEGLKRVAHMLTSFGGHRFAAGLRIEPGRIDEFMSELERVAAAALTPEDLRPRVTVDARIRPGDVSMGFLAEQEMLGPFGLGNPRPKYLWPGARPASAPRFMGREKKHVNLLFRADVRRRLRCLGWNMAERFRSFDRDGAYDLLVRPRYDDWRGEVALEIVDFRPAENKKN